MHKTRYSTEPRFRKYVKGYGFLSFKRKFVNKFGKRLMDAATKTGMDAAKIASKIVVQKTSEATEDLIWNKIADKITSIGKRKEKEKKQRNRGNLYSTRNKTTNYWWVEIILNAKCGTIVQGGNAAIAVPSGATFQITDTKLYVPVVTLSKKKKKKRYKVFRTIKIRI